MEVVVYHNSKAVVVAEVIKKPKLQPMSYKFNNSVYQETFIYLNISSFMPDEIRKQYSVFRK